MKRCEGPGCEVDFTPQRSTAKYCSATCRQRASRDKRAAEASTKADADQGKREHELVKAVRLELEDAGVAETFNGQLALQLARKLANPDESGISSLSKELRTVMAAALAGKDAPADEPAPDEPEDVEDEVTKARRAREQARQAAGLA